MTSKTRPPTIADVARHADVSIATARGRPGEHNTDGLLIFTHNLGPCEML